MFLNLRLYANRNERGLRERKVKGEEKRGMWEM